MFAIIESGSKQYKVSAGDKIEIYALGLAPGKDVEFKDVLLIADGPKVLVGRPVIEGAKVVGTAEGEKRGEKLFPLQRRRRKNSQRRIGHRQTLSVVRIKEIIVKQEVHHGT
jgi:large subunit ribosomal protein L21